MFPAPFPSGDLKDAPILLREFSSTATSTDELIDLCIMLCRAPPRGDRGPFLGESDSLEFDVRVLPSLDSCIERKCQIGYAAYLEYGG